MSTQTKTMEPFDVQTAKLSGTHLIEASAGTGKTWTLSTLVLRLVLERDEPLSSILVVTFTKAAAAELRGRVRLRLQEGLRALQTVNEPADATLSALLVQATTNTGQDKAQLQARLQRALAEFDEAAILTIHAFCQRALSDSAFAGQWPLTQEVQEDAKDLRLRVVADWWRQRIAAQPWNEALVTLLANEGDSPATWESLLTAAENAPLACALWPDPLAAPVTEQDPTHQALTRAVRDALLDAKAVWGANRPVIVGLLHKAAFDGQLPKNSYSTKRIEEGALALDRFFNDTNPSATPRWDGPAKLYESVFMHGKVRKNQQGPTHPFFTKLSLVMQAQSKLASTASQQRLCLIRDMLQTTHTTLQQVKTSQRIYTYHDMLTQLHHRTQHDDAFASGLRQRFSAALIDEFQDTDGLQLAIFQKLYNGTDTPVFLVGDPKQAIYSFRGADLHSYLAARADAATTATLLENQRSTPRLIAALNALFTCNEQAFADPDLQYHDVTASERPRTVLTDTRIPTGATPAALDIWTLPAEQNEMTLTPGAAEQLAIQSCAHDIAQTLTAASLGEVLLGDQPLRGGDIAVIVETHAQGRRMREALAEFGVPCVELSRASVLQTTEATEVSRVLNGILDSTNPAAVRAALATELLHVDAYTLASTTGEDTSADALAHEAHVDAIWAQMAAWRQVWSHRGIAAMLWQVFDNTHLAQRMLAQSDGERRMTNWLHLLELLNEAAQANAAPSAVVAWFDTQRCDSQADSSDAALLRLESDQHLVQIITVHRSKGLEYPIVYAPLLWKSSRRADIKLGTVYHDSKGQHVIDYRVQKGDSLTSDVKKSVLHEVDCEQVRKIYVALTRAAHRCTLVVSPHVQASGKSNSYTSLKSMLNWLVGGQGQTLEAWQALDKDGAPLERSSQLLLAWRTLGKTAGDVGEKSPVIAVHELGASPVLAARLPREAVPSVVVHQAPGPIWPAWRLGSFSAWLQHPAESADALRDDRSTAESGAAPGDGLDAALAVDARRPMAAAALQTPIETFVAEPDDVLHFPKGPSAGDTVHAAFEHADFTLPTTWPTAVRSALRRHPQTGNDGQPQPAAHESMLLNMLADVVATDIAPGLRLSAIGATQRLSELEFDMSLTRTNVGSLTQALASVGLQVPPLSPAVLQRPFTGHLRGFMDMVFEHQGRHYVVDWKSNHLGSTPLAYHDAGMERAMQVHGYHLQATLYALALRRHLRLSLGDQNLDAAWGGAVVLFVRGVRPSWRQADGRPTGVVFNRLPPKTLDALDAMLGVRGQREPT